MLGRKNNSHIGSWWWTVDRLSITALLFLCMVSAILVTSASPAVAERIGADAMFFVRKQLYYLAFSIVVMLVVSMFSSRMIKWLSVSGLVMCAILLVITLKSGMEIKGARRWVTLAGLSLQASEFVKPFFAVCTAWILSNILKHPNFPSFTFASLLYLSFCTLIILQPDLGMVVTLSVIWGGQLFLAGLPVLWIATIIFCGVLGLAGAYVFLPHVTHRINSFIDPSGHDNYQVNRSLDAFIHGGFFGKGPGEGVVKQVLPDSHADFIFAVLGEELGMVSCFLVIVVFATIVGRGFIRVARETDLFMLLAASGLLIQFGIQAIINMGVTLHLLPTKGMTLPFISYGGSSMLAIAIGMGMMLACTRKRFGYHKFSHLLHKAHFVK